MSEVKKLDLSAMMHNPGSGNAVIAEKNIEENTWVSQDTDEKKVQKTSGIKINLSSIKSDKKPEPIKEIVEKPAEIKDEQTLYFESLTSRVIKKPTLIQEQTKNEKKLKISALKTPINKVANTQNTKIENKEDTKLKISALKQPILSCKIADKEKYIQHKSDKNIDTTKNMENNSWEVFHNYESEFKKKETSVLDSIAKIKAIAQLKKLSKTNKIFLASIIWVTIIWLSFIFHIDPNTHSLDNYKASILTLAGKEMSKQEVMDHQWDIQDEIAWKLEENNLGWYNLWFEILVNENWDAVYKFDGKEYESKDLLDLAISEKLEVLKKEKILDYFKTNKQNNAQENTVDVDLEDFETSQNNQDDILLGDEFTQEFPEEFSEEYYYEEMFSEDSQYYEEFESSAG